jgi:hypothetical protein
MLLAVGINRALQVHITTAALPDARRITRRRSFGKS